MSRVEGGPWWRDGRLFILILAAGFSMAMMALGSADRPHAWRDLGVPAMEPDFADARVITSGWQCTMLGFDVLVENPCDPWGRRTNYPRVWTLPGFLGLGQGSTRSLALFSAGAFFSALLWLIGRLPIGSTAVYALALASPSVLLSIERGNNDLIMFALMTGSVVLVAKHRFGGAGALLLSAAVLKLFPVVAIGALPGLRRRLILLLVFAVYVLATIQDVRLAVAGVAWSPDWSYGLTTNAATLLPWALPWDASAILALLGLGAAFLISRRFPRPGTSSMVEASFTVGASVYLATYLLGPSWAYRLIFLLLILPMAIEMARCKRPTLLILSLLVLWLVGTRESSWFVTGQLVQFMLAVAVSALVRVTPLSWRNHVGH